MLGAAVRTSAAVFLCTLVACGGGGAGPAPMSGLIARSGQDVITATKAEGTATFTVRDQGDVDVAFDFARDRARTRMQLPVGDGTTVDVESRTVDGTSYVKDGSWMCPGCGFDDEDPPLLPKDKWIVVDAADDVAFGLDANAFHGQLAWLRLVDEPVAPGATSRLADGTPVAAYRVEIPVAEANAAIDAAAPAGDEVPRLEGRTIVITFTADARARLRELVVEYSIEGEARTLTATLVDYRGSIDIEVPPVDDIYVAPDGA